MLASGFNVMAVGLGAAAPLLSADPELEGCGWGLGGGKEGGDYRKWHLYRDRVSRP